MVKYSGGPVISDVFIMPPRPYICPDCHTMHKGECPLQVQRQLANRLMLIDDFSEALADHASHIDSLIQSLQEIVRGLEDQEAAIIQLHERLSRLEAATSTKPQRSRAPARRSSSRRGPVQ